MRNNKQGIWRIIEGVFAALIIASTLLFFLGQISQNNQTSTINQELNQALTAIANDPVLRAEILTENTAGTEIYLANTLKNNQYTTEITLCDFGVSSCGNPPTIETTIHAQEYLITGTNEVNSKIIKLYTYQNI